MYQYVLELSSYIYIQADSKENDPNFKKNKDHPFQGVIDDFFIKFGGDNVHNEYIISVIFHRKIQSRSE